MGATERKMQIQIFVLVVAALALSNGAPQAAKVKVFGLYETMCPDCIRWVAPQAKPVMDELHEIMEVDFVPYGKASGSNGNYHCQHGKVECEGNKVHACARKYVTDNHKLADYMYCMIRDNTDYLGVAKSCASDLGIDYDTIKTCYETEGNDLFEEMGRLTKQYTSHLSYVPTVGINGKVDSYAENQLKDAVCDAYEGSFPACN